MACLGGANAGLAELQPPVFVSRLCQAATAAQHVNTEQTRCGAANSMERQFGLFYAHQKQLKK